jgi:hypothetical protein
VIKRFFERPWAVFALVFAWKVALLLLSAQPIPANDAFFYDGPVVHLLNHGGYFNPSIALSRPISGTEFFSAYPPLYQLVLLAWMSLFGTSALAAMWLHMSLFGAYLLVVLAIFRQLGVPSRCANLAGLFLLAITFHDRPDSAAHVLGMLGVYAQVRAHGTFHGSKAGPAATCWPWLAAGFVVLAVCTSLQIGAIYGAWVGLAALAAWAGKRSPLPILPLAMMALAPAGLIALVHFGFPRLWAGFTENVRHNASLSGLHMPAIDDLLKIGRNVPGLLVAAGLMLAAAARRPRWLDLRSWSAGEIFLNSGMVAALLLLAGCFSVVAPNWVQTATYLQPVLVGLFLASMAAHAQERARSPVRVCWVVALASVAAIRAVGMSTWGLACARDVSYESAIQRVRAELGAVPPGANVILSSPYLYEADRHTNGVWIHSDYPMPQSEVEDFPAAMRRLRTSKLVLSQFDYYRRYQPVLEQLRAGPDSVQITITDTARVCPPDSYRRFRKVVQHVAWAPVIVDLSWGQAP